MRSASGSTSTRPLVDVEGDWREVTASIEDRSNMSYEMLLGRDVLDRYSIELASDVGEPGEE